LWHLFDILSILSDNGQCDPALLFWLVEELLDSQTIAGCRLIFDYLESRRERITAKHFKAKHLVILRSCNELLRRLSRAKDTAFCGRVFIFLFQSFPLGDRSSVNLRGEYHVENVTTYEDMPADDGSKMDVDPQVSDSNATNAKADAKDSTKPMSSDELYHLFWPLQDFFSQPLKLFDPSNLSKFKKSIEETVKKFQTCTPENISRSASLAESTSSSLKRKRDEVDHADTFNPKYLTSKDLFDLEVWHPPMIVYTAANYQG
jgi:THO complex subunit 1